MRRGCACGHGPGIEQRVITSLGVDADLLIALGPVWVDDNGWYLVRDADADDPRVRRGLGGGRLRA